MKEWRKAENSKKIMFLAFLFIVIFVQSNHHIFHFGQSFLFALDKSLFCGLQFNFTLFFIDDHEAIWCSQCWLPSVIPRTIHPSVLIKLFRCLLERIYWQLKFMLVWLHSRYIDKLTLRFSSLFFCHSIKSICSCFTF